MGDKSLKAIRQLPLVTVITPVYNGERFLLETLESISRSNYPNFEMVVVDDGSTDSTRSILDEFEKSTNQKFTRVTKSNTGEADSDNLGLKLSNGEYVMFLSADDLVDPQLLSRSVAILQEFPEIVVTYPNWKKIDEENQVLEHVDTEAYSVQALVGDMICIPGPGAVIRKSALPEGFARRPEYRYISDFRQWLDLAVKGDFMRIDEYLASWRVHREQQTSAAASNGLARELEVVMVEYFRTQALPDKILKLRNQAVSQSYYRSAIQSLANPLVPGRRLLSRSVFTFFRRDYSGPHRNKQYRRSLGTALQILLRSGFTTRKVI